MRRTETRMSSIYGEVIPASVKQEVDKLVDRTKMRRSAYGKIGESSRALTDLPVSTHNRLPSVRMVTSPSRSVR
jgi:hypothetical protein